MMEELQRLIRRRIVRKILMGMRKMRVSHKNCGRAMFVVLAMRQGRRMKSGAKHRNTIRNCSITPLIAPT